jgi:hypothetical protein
MCHNKTEKGNGRKDGHFSVVADRMWKYKGQNITVTG